MPSHNIQLVRNAHIEFSIKMHLLKYFDIFTSNARGVEMERLIVF